MGGSTEATHIMLNEFQENFGWSVFLSTLALLQNFHRVR